MLQATCSLWYEDKMARKTQYEEIAPKGKMKRRLSEDQEFQIMKLVLDKFLWLGFGIMAFGLYQMFLNVPIGLSWMIAGAVILLLFTWIIVKEYEVIR